MAKKSVKSFQCCFYNLFSKPNLGVNLEIIFEITWKVIAQAVTEELTDSSLNTIYRKISCFLFKGSTETESSWLFIMN